MIQEVVAGSLGLLAVVCSYFYLKLRRPHGFPPGPPAYPFLGSLPALEEGPSHLDGGVRFHLALDKLKEEYGPVFSIALGHTWIVILGDYASMKEAFVTNGNTVSNRAAPDIVTAAWNPNFSRLGITDGDYDAQWKMQHLAMMQVMKNLGFGREKGEAFVQEEADFLIETLQSMENQSIKITDHFSTGVANVLMKFLLGERFDYDNADIKHFTESITLGFKGIDNCSGLSHVPLAKFLPSFRKDLKVLYEAFGEVNKFLAKKIEENPIDENVVQPRNFIEAYHMEMKKNPQLEDKTFQVLNDFFQAGIETTANILGWAILFLVTNPETQKKLQEEIDTVIGRSRKPRHDDTLKLPYMMATINETLRLACTVPSTLPHCTSSTCQVGGYTIPKNTQVWGNLWGIMRNPDTFKDPLDFKPERFLDAKGQLINIQELIPFSIGRRICPGLQPARQVLYVFLSHLLQTFTFTPSKGSEKPTCYGVIVASHKTPDYEIYATPRD